MREGACLFFLVEVLLERETEAAVKEKGKMSGGGKGSPLRKKVGKVSAGNTARGRSRGGEWRWLKGLCCVAGSGRQGKGGRSGWGGRSVVVGVQH